jgi:pilus assembly protein CpaB
LRSSLFLFVAITLGAIASALLFLKLNTGAKTSTIVYAVQPIEAGQKLSSSQISERPWAEAKLPAGAFSNARQVIGRIARVPIEAERPVFVSDLARAGADIGLASIIAEGSRAISVESDEISGVAGFVKPGSYVDVLVSGRDQLSEPFSKIVLQRVVVLAVEQDTRGETDKPEAARSVTLQLDPEQAEQLDLARSIGKLSLVLRNQFDSRKNVSKGARMGDLLGNGAMARPAAASPTPTAVVARPVAAPVRPAPRSRAFVVEEIRGTTNIAEAK